jgi:hypothetical protein
MSKKLPLKTNENGMVGKPAEPTAAPGGRDAVAACVAGAGVAVVLGVVDPAPPVLEDPDAASLLATAAEVAAGVDGAAWVPDPAIFSALKSIRAS